MTEEEIMNMKEGRDLDALIAEKIMGLNVVSMNHPCGYDPECGEYEANHFFPIIGSWFNEEGPVYLPENGIYPPVPELEPAMGESYCYVTPVPFYSHSLSHAWQIVDKLNEHYGFDVEIISHYPGKDCIAHFWQCDPNMPIDSFADDYVARADTVPLAICRAALMVTSREEKA
jgi:hypothetical protein